MEGAERGRDQGHHIPWVLRRDGTADHGYDGRGYCCGRWAMATMAVLSQCWGRMLAAPRRMCSVDTCHIGQIGPTRVFVPRLRRDIFVYSECDIVLNGHGRFPQEGKS